MTDHSSTSTIIGGMFGLESGLAEPAQNGFPFLTGQTIYLANASSGLFLLIKQLSPPQVWLPSYLCYSMAEAVEKAQGRIKFYEVSSNLKITPSEWLEAVQPNDLVLLVDYFGFPFEASLATEARKRGAWILEDACQALLSAEVGHISDFVLFSPRKFVGVPDGGVLISKENTFNFTGVKLAQPAAAWWLKALSATVLRREFDLYGGNQNWFQLFQEAEAESPVGLYAMSQLSQTLLSNTFDYKAITAKRRENYMVLLQSLKNISLFPELLPGVVPLGFPIRVKLRDRLRQVLFDHKIYPPIHWPIQDFVPPVFSGSHNLANEIMTLPCDQRYNADDMERMASTIRKELNH